MWGEPQSLDQEHEKQCQGGMNGFFITTAAMPDPHLLPSSPILAPSMEFDWTKARFSFARASYLYQTSERVSKIDIRRYRRFGVGLNRRLICHRTGKRERRGRHLLSERLKTRFVPKNLTCYASVKWCTNGHAVFFFLWAREAVNFLLWIAGFFLPFGTSPQYNIIVGVYASEA